MADRRQGFAANRVSRLSHVETAPASDNARAPVSLDHTTTLYNSRPTTWQQLDGQSQSNNLISDVAGETESPGEERDEADVLNEIIGAGRGSYVGVTGSIPVSGTRRQQGPGSYSSHRSWRSGVIDVEGLQSVNPAREAAESLRSWQSSFDSFGVRPAMSRTQTGERDTQRDSGVEMAQEQDERRQDGKMDGALPEDDGLRSLRQKLHEIRTLAVSTEEKAKRMHQLMTQDYLAHRGDHGVEHAGSPEQTPSLAGPVDPNNPYNVHTKDFEPTFSPLPVRHHDSHGDHDEAMEDELPPILGCQHYKRNVKVQCFDCRRWFPCRHCHDQAPDLPFKHQLNRKKTENMLCMLCRTPQPAAETCINCGEYAAWYYCPKCKLWDNDNNKRIYHCDDCGICRVGEGLGKDYVHCRRCNVCISISTSASHPCIERATEGDCPLCLVRLFESSTPVVSLPCGHYMHGECYKDLMAVTYKCPVCSRSAVNMEIQWRKLDDEILAQPMPENDEELEGLLPPADVHVPDDADVPTNGSTTAQQPLLHPRRPRTVWVGCNDCGSRSWTPFHWLGLKCQVCDSYNTNQMAPTADQETDAERMIRQQQLHTHRQHDFTGNYVLQDAGIGANENDQITIDRNALQVPTSPSQDPVYTNERRASGAQSPGRYFVQEEAPRRASFTAPRFTTPSMPNLPNLPEMPRLPRMPNLPNLRDLTGRDLPNFRDFTGRELPNFRDFTGRDMPELPRFSPYEMFDAVSRSLSPMRYYLQGLDVTDRDLLRGVTSERRNRSPTTMSVRSDPLAVAGTSRGVEGERKRSVSGSMVGGEDALWGSEEDDEEEDDGDDADGSVRAARRDAEETSEEEEEESEDEETGHDEDLGDEDDEHDEMELFGHR